MPQAVAFPAPDFKAAVKAPAAPNLEDVKATVGVAAAPADANVPRRVASRTNKIQAPRRYSSSWSSNVAITTVLLLLLFLLLLIAAAGVQDVIVLAKLCDVAETIWKVAVEICSAQFLMVLCLVINDTVHNTGHFLTNSLARHSFEKRTNNLVPTWIEETCSSKATALKRRDKRSPILAAVGIVVGVSALFNLFSGSLISKKISDIKSKQAIIYKKHMQSQDNEV